MLLVRYDRIVLYDIVYKGYKTPQVVNWRDTITLYVISDFIATYLNCEGKCVRKMWIKNMKNASKQGKNFQINFNTN